MDREDSSDCIATTLHNLCRYWAERQKSHEGPVDSAIPHPLTIALSREAGTQGAAVAREVGAKLGWQVYDHELLERIAQDLGVRTILLDRVDERRKSWLKESFESLLGVPFVSEATYVHRLIKTVLALATHGECVIVGRGAPSFCRRRQLSAFDSSGLYATEWKRYLGNGASLAKKRIANWKESTEGTEVCPRPFF